MGHGPYAPPPPPPRATQFSDAWTCRLPPLLTPPAPPLESPRSKHFKMGDDQKGVLVRSVQPISHAHGLLVPGDVLLKFDGVEVASGGWGGRCGA